MRKLVIPAIGIALVAIDFRPGPVDLLVDPVGWAMVAVGAWMLRARLVASLAVAAGLLSTAGVHFAYHYVFVDPSTHEVTEYCESAIACTPQFRFDDLTDGRTMVLALAAVLGAAALSLLAHILRTDVGSAEHQVTLRRQLRVLELLIPITWAGPMLVLATKAVTSDNTYDPIWNGNPAYIGATRGLVLLWLAVVLVMFANEIPRPVRTSRSATPGAAVRA